MYVECSIPHARGLFSKKPLPSQIKPNQEEETHVVESPYLYVGTVCRVCSTGKRIICMHVYNKV